MRIGAIWSRGKMLHARSRRVQSVAIALVTIPVFLTGKAAEDIVEHLPGVSEDLIENHERAATIALVATSILGALSVLRLLIPARFAAIGGPMTIVIFVLSLGVAGWLGRTANLGGQIRHPEIRASSISAGDDEVRENKEIKADEDEEEAREDKEDEGARRRRGRD